MAADSKPVSSPGVAPVPMPDVPIERWIRHDETDVQPPQAPTDETLAEGSLEIRGEAVDGALPLIPDEVTLKIFSMLDVQSIGRAAQVSRAWSLLTSDFQVWNHRFKPKPPPLQPLSKEAYREWARIESIPFPKGYKPKPGQRKLIEGIRDSVLLCRSDQSKEFHPLRVVPAFSRMQRMLKTPFKYGRRNIFDVQGIDIMIKLANHCMTELNTSDRDRYIAHFVHNALLSVLTAYRSGVTTATFFNKYSGFTSRGKPRGKHGQIGKLIRLALRAEDPALQVTLVGDMLETFSIILAEKKVKIEQLTQDINECILSLIYRSRSFQHILQLAELRQHLKFQFNEKEFRAYILLKVRLIESEKQLNALLVLVGQEEVENLPKILSDMGEISTHDLSETIHNYNITIFCDLICAIEKLYGQESLLFKGLLCQLTDYAAESPKAHAFIARMWYRIGENDDTIFEHLNAGVPHLDLRTLEVFSQMFASAIANPSELPQWFIRFLQNPNATIFFEYARKKSQSFYSPKIPITLSFFRQPSESIPRAVETLRKAGNLKGANVLESIYNDQDFAGPPSKS